MAEQFLNINIIKHRSGDKTFLSSFVVKQSNATIHIFISIVVQQRRFDNLPQSFIIIVKGDYYCLS